MSRNTIYELIRTSELRVAPIRLGRRMVFSRAKVEEFLGWDAELSGGPVYEVQQEAERYRETLEHVIDFCRRA